MLYNLTIKIYCCVCNTKIIEWKDLVGEIIDENITYKLFHTSCKNCLRQSYDKGYKDGYDWATGGQKALEGEGKEGRGK